MAESVQSVQTFGRKVRLPLTGAPLCFASADQIAPSFRPAEDGHRRVVLQARARPYQDQRRPDRACPTGMPAVQGDARFPASWGMPPLIRRADARGDSGRLTLLPLYRSAYAASD